MRMRVLLILLSLFLWSCSPQVTLRGRSEPGIVNMDFYATQEKQAVVLPAHLVLEDRYFEDANQNQALDAGEEGILVVQVRNDGLGPGQLGVRLTPLGSTEHISYQRLQSGGSLPVQQSKMLRIPIRASEEVGNGTQEIRVEVTEDLSRSVLPFTFRFETRRLFVPEFRVILRDYDEGLFYAGNQPDGRIQAGEMTRVVANVQNLGGDAEEVVLAVENLSGDDVRYVRDLKGDSNNRFPLGNMASGDNRDIEFYFFTTPIFSREEVRFFLGVDESRKRFGTQDTLVFDIGQSVRTEDVLEVTGQQDGRTTMARIESGLIDIEEIPKNSKTQLGNGIAVIFGIEEYRYTFPAGYKVRDATTFYQYCRDVWGIPEERIVLRTDSDATKAEFDYVFEPMVTPNQGWLKKRLKDPNEAAEVDLFVFLGGHGFSDLSSGIPFLIPYDVRPEQTTNGVSLKTLYQTLGDYGTRSVTVFVESCFSGMSGYDRSGTEKLLAMNMNPVGLRLLKPMVRENTVVFAATSGDKPSSNRDDLKHGIFTYFVLKGMGGDADLSGDRQVTVEELFRYVRREVPRKALELPLDREQVPELLPAVEQLGERGTRVLVRY